MQCASLQTGAKSCKSLDSYGMERSAVARAGGHICRHVMWRGAGATAQVGVVLVQCQIECQMWVFEGKSGAKNSKNFSKLLIRLRLPAGSNPLLLHYDFCGMS